MDRDGTVVAKYVYDAWGNGKVCNASGTLNTSDSFIGNINPFRYRGYYYDVETGLYYLQTRYYDPQAGRFLNADSVDYIAPDLIGGLNLYAYCNNNPVMYSDPEGTLVGFIVLIGLAVTALAGGIIKGIQAYRWRISFCFRWSNCYSCIYSCFCRSCLVFFRCCRRKHRAIPCFRFYWQRDARPHRTSQNS